MNARNCRINLVLSPLDFPPINGLGGQSDFTQTEPPVIINNKVVLKITKKLIITDTYAKKEYEVFTAQSIYEIPSNDIKSREDIYDFYKDATLGLSEAYQYVKKQMPLPNLLFPTSSIETYQREIDGVFALLNQQN
jgi:hypothetical protein